MGRNHLVEVQTSDLLDKNIKITVLNILNGLQENIDKEQKQTRRMMYKQDKNISKEVETIKRNQKEILENTTNKIKNSLESFKSRFEQAEESANLK